MLDETQVRTALKDVAALVQADGGDIEFVRMDPASGAVELRLDVTSSNCVECILPKALLEDIAGDIMRRSVPSIASVTVDDPREHPDFVPGDH